MALVSSVFDGKASESIEKSNSDSIFDKKKELKFIYGSLLVPNTDPLLQKT